MAPSGTRTSSRSVCPSGFRNSCAVTSLGMSWAVTATVAATSARAVARRAERLSPKPFKAFFHTVPVVYFRVPDGGLHMKRTRNVAIGTSLLALLVALAIGQTALQRTAEAQAKGGAQAPRFEVDPMWPKPVPNHWVFGNII